MTLINGEISDDTSQSYMLGVMFDIIFYDGTNKVIGEGTMVAIRLPDGNKAAIQGSVELKAGFDIESTIYYDIIPAF